MSTEDVMAGVARRAVEGARAQPPGERDLRDTLLAAGVPFERVISLLADESMRIGRTVSAEHAWFIRENRMNQFPEGTAVHRRLGMIADMLDPAIENAYWDYEPDEQ